MVSFCVLVGVSLGAEDSFSVKFASPLLLAGVKLLDELKDGTVLPENAGALLGGDDGTVLGLKDGPVLGSIDGALLGGDDGT